MTKIRGEQFALASPYSKFWGDLSPTSPVIYAHGSLYHVVKIFGQAVEYLLVYVIMVVLIMHHYDCTVLITSVDSAAAVAADESDVSAEPGEARVQLPGTS